MKKMSRSEAMKSIIEEHNHSWYEDLYMRNKDNKEKTATNVKNQERWKNIFVLFFGHLK